MWYQFKAGNVLFKPLNKINSLQSMPTLFSSIFSLTVSSSRRGGSRQVQRARGFFRRAGRGEARLVDNMHGIRLDGNGTAGAFDADEQ